ncbi:hypothetical protein C8F04DRAFT_1070625 [Mycena alexandri]|uniref:Uncharacterized protein n=1 Tax=Mycena alexandri TaxID=1745969 RepID=A0AAD6TEK2_9AGAR|nr:hypothetical protein C8F04DRAFT_1070625 [Mycena alexandri]
MDTHLPDEIISEILSPALKVSDEEFSDTSPNSPFARYSESSSAFLLVCKAWLRVATPLLYHVVVLRSKAQASALDSALRRNSELGRWVKKLRVEGGYGSCMLKIMAAVPNVTDLFISVDIWSSDNVSGLIKGLPSLNPTRVVFYDPPYGRRRNKNSEGLVQAITQSLKDWKNLAVFELSNSFASSTMFSIAASLRVAPALKTIVTPISYGIFSQHPPEHLVLMAKNPSLERIQLKPARPRFGMTIPNTGFSSPPHPLFRGLIQMPENDVPGSVHSSAPSSRSIQYSTASVPDNIWKRILYFAAAPDIQGSKWIPHSRFRLVLVSKKFARLAMPYLKETLYFRSPLTFDDLGPVLRSDLSFRLTRNLYVDTNANMNLRPVFSSPLVNIIGLTMFYVSSAVFSELAKKCGQTLVRLEGLTVAKGNKPLESSVFAQFINIRSLALGFKSPFAKSPSIPSSTLATLEQLKITQCDRTLITVLSEMDLPALREVIFQVDNARELDLGTFLTKHGGKLRRVDLPNSVFLNTFNVCPAVVDLTIFCGNGTPNASLYTCTTPHASLQTITFKTDGRFRGAERKWAGFFDSLSVLTFPALRQISLPCIKWPTTEHDIGKSLWVQWAERLLDHNVTLVDSNGVGWRRRLKK